jgi:hypothetical protein
MLWILPAPKAAEGLEPASFGVVAAENIHRVSTSNVAAQTAFADGMMYRYAFNAWAAERAFRRAAALDPQMAMAHWGIALALGADLNTQPTPGREAMAVREIAVARGLEARASGEEKAFIEALALRYPPNGQDLTGAAHSYSTAMQRLSQTWPDDPDAVVLYAESLMDLHTDGIFFAHGRPLGDATAIAALLAGVLKKYPKHLGANHLYIHVMAQSDSADLALPSAQYLASQDYPPGASHLLHMAVHVFYRLGRYEDVIDTSTVTLGLDELCATREREPDEYSALYYHTHNIEYMLAASLLDRNFTAATAAADKLATLEAKLHVSIRFGRWNDILAFSLPASISLPIDGEREYRFARTMAFANLGRTGEARREAARFAGPAALSLRGDAWQRNVGEIETQFVQAALARSVGRTGEEVRWLRAAVAKEDTIVDADLPTFFMPVREWLAPALEDAGRHKEARSVWLEDLRRNPGNAWARDALAPKR